MSMKELRVCMESALPDKEVKKAWFTLPIDEVDVLEKLGVDVDNDEYRLEYSKTELPYMCDVLNQLPKPNDTQKAEYVCRTCEVSGLWCNMALSGRADGTRWLRCRTYTRNTNLCTSHTISVSALQQIVMNDIQRHIKNMEALGDQFLDEMKELSEKGGNEKIQHLKHSLEVTEKRIEEIDNVIMKLFEQNALGKISDERFEKMSISYENEQNELKLKRNDLKDKIESEEKKTQSTNQFLETIRKYENVTELNRAMLVELIDSIYVYQAEGTGKEKTQKVEINYRFLAGSQCGIA